MPRWAGPGTGADTEAVPALAGTGAVQPEDTAGIGEAGRPAAAQARGPAGIRAAVRIEGTPVAEHIGDPAAVGKLLGAEVVGQDCTGDTGAAQPAAVGMHIEVGPAGTSLAQPAGTAAELLPHPTILIPVKKL